MIVDSWVHWSLPNTRPTSSVLISTLDISTTKYLHMLSCIVESDTYYDDTTMIMHRQHCYYIDRSNSSQTTSTEHFTRIIIQRMSSYARIRKR